MYIPIAIDILINMCILIDMHIYITPDNEKLLREYSNEGTMSGLINSLLEEFFSKTENPSRPADPPTPELEEESQDEPEDEYQPTYEEQGYVYDPATKTIYDTNYDPPERVIGKVDKQGKIIAVD
jgi:hypothetical protein